MSEKISLGQLRGTKLHYDIERILRKSSVLFSTSPDLRYGGSGTLVTYKNTQGILTATHVVANSMNIKNFFSPLLQTNDPTLYLPIPFSIEKIILIESQEGISILTKNGGYDLAAETLDICLLEISKPIFQKALEISGKVAVDLLQQQQKYLASPAYYWAPNDELIWSWGIYGFPREGTAHDSEGIVHSKNGGLYLSGGKYKLDTKLTHVIPSFVEQETDICIHEFGPTKDALPNDFSGLSGGGVTQISLLRSKNGSIEIDEMLFAGVAVSGGLEFLQSRGLIALYEVFTKHLDNNITSISS